MKLTPSAVTALRTLRECGATGPALALATFNAGANLINRLVCAQLVAKVPPIAEPGRSTLYHLTPAGSHALARAEAHGAEAG